MCTWQIDYGRQFSYWNWLIKYELLIFLYLEATEHEVIHTARSLEQLSLEDYDIKSQISHYLNSAVFLLNNF